MARGFQPCCCPAVGSGSGSGSGSLGPGGLIGTVPCENCLGGVAPRLFCVEISGFEDGTAACSQINGRYFAAVPDFTVPGGTFDVDPCDPDDFAAACYWLCSDTGQWAKILLARCISSGNFIFMVEIKPTVLAGATVRWTKDYGTSPPDCVSFAAEELTFDPSSGGGLCGLTSVPVCLLTARAEIADTPHNRLIYCCDPGPCFPGKHAREIDVTFTDFELSDFCPVLCSPATPCPDFNGTWRLSLTNEGDECGWTIPVDPPICDVAKMELNGSSSLIMRDAGGIIQATIPITTAPADPSDCTIWDFTETLGGTGGTMRVQGVPFDCAA